MKYLPHDYQAYTTKYIEEHPIAAVLLDMGLGKTVSTLTALNDLLFDSFEIHKVLVVAPLRVAMNTWPEEVKKWDHLKNLKVAVAVGSKEERMKAMRSQSDIYLINRENVEWLITRSGLSLNFDTLVIDELSSFKNHQAKRFKSLMKIRPSFKRIIGLTGTPAGNGLMDLFAEIKLLDGGERLGRFITAFQRDYFFPEKFNGQIVYSYKPKPGAEEAIYKRISDITISMKAKDHLKMPEKIILEYPASMSSEEHKLYQRMKKDMTIPEGGITAANAAALSGKLSQMANGAVYNDNGEVKKIHDRKLDALEDLIEAANGHPILVAYQFQHDRQRILERFNARDIKTGKDINDWNEGKIPVALIHPASAGHGLNLQHGGNILIWFGLTWSLELYQQTNARLWRQGQDKPVTIYHIITKGTIDSHIMAALKSKDRMQDRLIEAVKAEVKE